MPRISKELVIAAPADAVWQVLGPGFARIGDWSTAIPASSALPVAGDVPSGPADGPRLTLAGVAAGLDDAPVGGRICATGLQMVPVVTETLVAYDEISRRLTYEASGMPAFVTAARNTWTVIALGKQQCRVVLDAQFDTRGLLGMLARRLLLLQVGRTSRYLADDLRHYVE